MMPTMLEHITLNLGISSGVGVLIAKATVDLSGGVALLGRSVLVVGEDLVDDRLDRSEPGSLSVAVPDGFACVSELSGDLSDGHAIATSPANRAIVIHRKHVLGLREGDPIPVGTFTLTKAAAVGSF
jgi:hypothetical protein